MSNKNNNDQGRIVLKKESVDAKSRLVTDSIDAKKSAKFFMFKKDSIDVKKVAPVSSGQAKVLTPPKSDNKK